MKQAPKPYANETSEQYTVRAHQALMDAIPDPEKRNTMVWSAWQHAKGITPAEQRAKEHFSDNEKFVHSPNHCYFVEHETTNNDGDPIQFSLDDLVEIQRNCNKRASDRKAFAAISDNHTSPTDQSHTGDPPVLGAVGNYKLGMIGHEDPKWAIFADEFHKAEHVQKLADKPRRSVELITFHNTGERFFDPIAALGGRAPRLPLPSMYSVQTYSVNGQPVSRYQIEGPAMSPSGGNTHIKSTDYFGGDEDPNSPEDSMNSEISDEAIAQIVNAIGNMPEFAWVRDQMDSQNGGAVSPDSPGGMDDVGEGSFPNDNDADDGFEDMNGDGLDDDMDIDQNAAFTGEASGGRVVTNPSEDTPGDDMDFEKQYSASSGPNTETHFDEGSMNYSTNSDNFVSVEQYNALATSHRNMLKQLKHVAKEMKQNEQDKSDATRRGQIENVCSDYPGVFDASEECSRLLYSAGANISDEQFGDEIKRLKTVASRASIQRNTIPAGTIHRAGQNGTVQRNAAWFEKSTEIQTSAANRGEHYNWDELQQKTDEALSK